MENKQTLWLRGIYQTSSLSSGAGNLVGGVIWR